MYYAERKDLKNGKLTPNIRTGDKSEMERQFFLYCASAAENASGNEQTTVEFGIFGVQPQRFESWRYPQPEPEPEPEPEPAPDPEPDPVPEGES